MEQTKHIPEKITHGKPGEITYMPEKINKASQRKYAFHNIKIPEKFTDNQRKQNMTDTHKREK